jgi:hypothetical protein
LTTIGSTSVGYESVGLELIKSILPFQFSDPTPEQIHYNFRVEADVLLKVRVQHVDYKQIGKIPISSIENSNSENFNHSDELLFLRYLDFYWLVCY